MIGGQGQRSKLDQVIILTNAYFSSIYQWINFNLGVKVTYGLSLSLLVFEGRSTLTFIVSVRVENCVPQGQILKLKEPYHVVPRMKVLGKSFADH
jgi:hypothetical protein